MLSISLLIFTIKFKSRPNMRVFNFKFGINTMFITIVMSFQHFAMQ